MKQPKAFCLASGAVLLAVVQAVHAQPLPPNSRFEVQMTRSFDSGNPIVQGAQFLDSHADEFTNHSLFGAAYAYSQIARFEVDLNRGTLKGFHSASTESSLDSTRTSLQLYWNPTIRIVSTGGPSTGALPLEMFVRLSGEFDTDDVAKLTSSATQQFSAAWKPQKTYNSETLWMADLSYSFLYQGKSQPTIFSHNRSATVSDDNCPGCTAEITGGDDNFAYGFDNLTMRTVMNVEPGSEINLNFLLTGSTSVADFGAYGDWSRTAAFGFVLPEGYALQSDTGISLTGWNEQPVPEPSAFALMLAGLGAAGWRLRRRRYSRASAATSSTVRT